MCLDRLFLPQWFHCSGKQGRVASGRGSSASGGPRFLGEKNLEAGAAGEGDKWQKGRGKFCQHALLHHQAVLHYTLPPLPLHLLLIIIILLLLLIILLLFLLFM